MNVDRLNRWLSLGANVGVIAGIIFLGYEIRQNSALLNAEIRSTTLQQRTDLVDMLFNNPDAIELLNQDENSLDDAQLNRLRLLGTRVLISMEHNYLEALIGLQDIDELARRYRTLTYRENLNFNILLAWETYGQTADQGFAVWFEENVVRQ